MSGWQEVVRAVELRGPTGAASISELKALPAGYQSGEVFVQGYYLPGDGGGGMFRWNPSSSATDDGGLVIRPAANPATGRWERVADKGVVYPEWWGAKGDYSVTDDTAAIQTAVNYVVANGGLVRLSNKWYKITAPITFSPVGTFNQLRWGVVGWHSALVQHTSNTPIFRILDSFPNDFLFEGIYFYYIANQPATNTSAVAIRCEAIHDSTPTGVGTYNFAVRNCQFINCYRGVTQSTGGDRPIWGFTMDKCIGETGMSGALVYLQNAASDQPNIHIKDTYIKRNNSMSTQEPSLDIRNAINVNIENVEINEGGGGAVMRIQNCADARVVSCRVEAATLLGTNNYLYDFAASNILVDGLQVQSTVFGAAPGSNQYIFIMYSGGNYELRGIEVMYSSFGAQPVYLLWGGASPNTLGSLSLSSLNLQSGMAGKYETVTDFIPSGLKYDSSEARRAVTSSDRGDASVTLTMADAPIQRFNTALTANRTVTLPTTGLFNGAYFEVIRGSSATGAFNVTVKDASTTYADLNSPNQHTRVTYTGSTWIESANGSAWAAYGRLSSNQTTTAQTATSVSGMSFPVAANEVWTFEFVVRAGSSATTGNTYAISVPSGATLMAEVFGNTTAHTAFSQEVLTASATLSATSYAAIADQNSLVRVFGTCVNGATAGTVQLQQAKTTSGTATANANSYFRAARLS